MKRHHQGHVIGCPEILHFLPGQVVRPQGENGAAGPVKALGLPVSMDTAGEEHAHIRMGLDEFPARCPGQLGIGKEINMPRFYGFFHPISGKWKREGL
jgi:hypothetical protein